MITRQRAATKDFSVSVFLRLGWFFKDQWRRYLVAISLLMLVALLTVIPPKVVGWVVDGIAKGDLDSGTLTESRYYILAKQAGYIIDAATMGRARDAPGQQRGRPRTG